MGGSPSTAKNTSKTMVTTTSNNSRKRVVTEKQLSSIEALVGSVDLERAVATIVLVFYTSERDGRLSRAGVRDLLLTHFQAFTRGQEIKPKYKEIFGELEADGEKKIGLEDFLLFIISLTVTSDLLPDIHRAAL
ncbi:sentan-like [Hypomesus transpacificus]|uniref:sentan-like n=1 Tax=Hypomesus transpacificus TaxID=137520 RepID=UPI001F0798C3|nr:sentan-like [Hypomesus transpacificus]